MEEQGCCYVCVVLCGRFGLMDVGRKGLKAKGTSDQVGLLCCTLTLTHTAVQGGGEGGVEEEACE